MEVAGHLDNLIALASLSRLAGPPETEHLNRQIANIAGPTPAASPVRSTAKASRKRTSKAKK
jgi:hypothetical protein